MKAKLYYVSLVIGTFLASCGSKPAAPAAEETPTPSKITSAPFSVAITEDNSFKNLPALQSHVLASSGNYWLLFGGRTNGLHDFPDYEDKSFPIKFFNDTIYVYDVMGKKCVARISSSVVGKPYNRMFKSTNAQSYQDGNMLYVCGGYGEVNDPKSNNQVTDWQTFPYMAQINIPEFIAALMSSPDSTKVKATMTCGTNPNARITGGELYKMGEYFYLAGGHNYGGVFYVPDSTAENGTNQVYQDGVTKFQLSATAGKLTMSNITKITDGLADDETQFRRRDLPIVPALHLVSNIALEESITFYGGVFTSPTNKVKGLIPNGTWTNPIYIRQDGGYEVDGSYSQIKNVYSAPSFVIYDATNKILHTTIMGGIDSSNHAQFTNGVITISRSIDANNPYTIETDQAAIPGVDYHGAEAHMELINANTLAEVGLPILDWNKMVAANDYTIGYFYGGIEAKKDNPGGYGPGKSLATNKVYKVSVVKATN